MKKQTEIMTNFLGAVHQEYLELCDRLDRGKGEYGHQNYIKDATWAQWIGARSTLEELLREHCEYGDNGRLVLPNLQAGGDSNTGYGNTGNRNTGNRNTGDSNTGNRNTGNRNTGYGNTGDSNTGNRNTGYGNATNNCAGFFCIEEPKVVCFDVQTDLTKSEFMEKFPIYWNLSIALLSDKPLNFDAFQDLPGITPEKLTALHAKFVEGRKK